MKILCAVDFSKQTNSAVRFATDLARRFGDSVELLHVMPPPAASELASPEPLRAPTYTSAEEKVRELARAATQECGVAVDGQILLGHPSYLIVEHARSIEARLIVVGVDTGSVMARWFLGGVTERTVRLADRPVLVAPSHEGDPARSGLASWMEKGRPLRVLVGLDRSYASDSAIAFCGHLREAGDCDITFLHVYWPPEEYQRLGLLGRRELLDSDADVVASLEHELRHRTGTLPGKGAVSVAVRPGWGPTAANLLLSAELGEFDLIVVGTEHRQGLNRVWHGSVTEALVRRTTATPVLCVPGSAAIPPRFSELPRYTRVLVPTDLSPAGNQAVPYAYGLLRGGGGIIDLIHVHEAHLPQPTFAYDPPASTLTPNERAKLEAQLRALIPDQAEGLGIATHLQIIDGGTADQAILQAAERLDVDAISLGSHGHTGLAHVVLGSVADKVVRHARRPVLVVRPDASRRP